MADQGTGQERMGSPKFVVVGCYSPRQWGQEDPTSYWCPYGQ